MFDFVQKNQIFIKILLGGIALTFVGFGVGTYSGVSDSTVAKVDGEKIDRTELEKALRSQNADPQTQRAVLEQMIGERLLARQATRLNLTATDEAVRRKVLTMPAFQKDGHFDPKQYEAVLNSNGYQPANFESQMRRDLSVQALLQPLAESAVVSTTQLDRLVQLMMEQREVSVLRFDPAQFEATVQVADSAVKQYYDQHRSDFAVPERVKVNYLVLSPDALAAKVSVTPEAVQAAFEKEKARFAPEQRRARHILFAVAKDATPAQKAAVKKQAEEVLAKLKADPNQFPALAKQYSADKLSAEQGGDLGFFDRIGMVKPFADAVYKLQKDQLSGLVETEFGFHVIQLTDVKVPTFDEVKSNVEAELKQRDAQAQYAKSTEAFRNAAEEAKDLKPVADKLGLTIQSSDWITREQAAEPVLNSKEVREAVFQADVLSKGLNTEVIEQPNQLIVAHLLQREAARTKALQEVHDDIRKKLVREQALKLAKAEADKQLKALQSGQAGSGMGWAAPRMVARQDPELPAPVVRSVFRANASKLPAYLAAQLADGSSAVLKVSKVDRPAKVDPAQRSQIAQLMRSMVSQGELGAYQQWLGGELSVTRYPNRLVSNQTQN